MYISYEESVYKDFLHLEHDTNLNPKFIEDIEKIRRPYISKED